jgi:hypothetical protein
MLASRFFPPKKMTITLKTVAFWNVTPSTLVDGHPCFGESVASLFRVEEFPEDGVSMFSQNVGNDLPDYMVSHPRRQQSSCPPP